MMGRRAVDLLVKRISGKREERSAWPFDPTSGEGRRCGRRQTLARLGRQASRGDEPNLGRIMV